MRIVDLRSDTVTQPSEEMRQAIATAELGDDVYGEDPTVNALENMASEMLGKEAGLLVTSGTMGNFVSILAQCERGQEIILGEQTHIYNAEGGGASTLGGVAFHPIPNTNIGTLDLNQVENAVRFGNIHWSPTAMVAIENTQNACGGIPITPSYMSDLSKIAKSNGLRVHVDGARLFNAAVCLETPASELVKDADTVTFCLSKGLSAPVGSIVCGDKTTIAKAREWRKTLGAGMRQAGIIAAAGIVALNTMIERLSDDHANAKRLAKGLNSIPGFSIDPESVKTNLVFAEPPEAPYDLINQINNRGVLINARPGGTWRLTTHYGITSEDVDYAIDVIKSEAVS